MKTWTMAALAAAAIGSAAPAAAASYVDALVVTNAGLQGDDFPPDENYFPPLAEGGNLEWSPVGGAYVKIDQAAGKMGASAQTSCSNGCGVTTLATLSYDFNYQVAGAEVDTLTQLELTFRLHGDFSLQEGLGGAHALLGVYAKGTDRPAGSLGFGLVQQANGSPLEVHYNTEGWASESFSGGLFNRLFTVRYNVVGASGNVNVWYNLNVGAGNVALADFSQTATFGVAAPSNVLLTSDTGLTPTVLVDSAVPEPSQWALMILGFAGAGAAVRRRRSLAA